MKKKLIISAGTIILMLAAAAMYLLHEMKHFSQSPAGKSGEAIPVVINQGQSFSTTARLLHKNGLVSDLKKFKVLARYLKKDHLIKAGEYMLSRNMTPVELLDKLASGKVRYYKLTIPEGYNIHQVAFAVEQAGFTTADKFIEVTENHELLNSLEIPAKNLEGYLFPDTYHFSRGADGEKIARVMVNRFKKVFKPEWKERAEELGMTVHQATTLASIIEKETGAAEERPLISSVFHNRLKKGMRLETDPTVIYGIKDFDGNLTRKHLRTWTPYNTYKIRGLPPGPIANPGEAALEAALYPDKSDYIFFVSKKNSTHHFSTNIRDHNNAVRKYQLRRKRN